MPRSKSQLFEIEATWLPTPDAINALPFPLRDYIHRLEANLDRPGWFRRTPFSGQSGIKLLAKLAEACHRNVPLRSLASGRPSE